MSFNDLSALLFLYPTEHQQTALKKGNKRGKCQAIQIKQCKHICEAVFLSSVLEAWV